MRNLNPVYRALRRKKFQLDQAAYFMPLKHEKDGILVSKISVYQILSNALFSNWHQVAAAIYIYSKIAQDRTLVSRWKIVRCNAFVSAVTVICFNFWQQAAYFMSSRRKSFFRKVLAIGSSTSLHHYLTSFSGRNNTFPLVATFWRLRTSNTKSSKFMQ